MLWSWSAPVAPDSPGCPPSDWKTAAGLVDPGVPGHLLLLLMLAIPRIGDLRLVWILLPVTCCPIYIVFVLQ